MGMMMRNISERKVTKDGPKNRSCIILPQPSVPSFMSISMPMRKPFSVARKGIRQRSSEKVNKERIESNYKSKNNAFHWKVEKLQRIPKIHPLELTHVFVPNTKAQEVARRITDCFQKESIKANFDNLRAVIEGETVDHIHFVAKLFASNCAKQVVVEVQRVLGCSCRFNQIAKTVLNAAKGIRRNHPPNRGLAMQMNQNITADQGKSKESIKENIEISLNILRSSMYDTK